jgi:hypothetical protein
MRVPVPKAPEMTPTRLAWLLVGTVAFYLLMVAGYLIWPPLAIILTVSLAVTGIYLMGGEMLNIWFDGRKASRG